MAVPDSHELAAHVQDMAAKAALTQDNAKRAERAYRTVLAYGIEDTEEEAVTDLLTDLRHMSEQYGWTLDELVERSHGHYLAEKA